MPSERFRKLKPEKKLRIRNAALREFARTSYESASINQIIKDAGISRGSFYTYFDDRFDLVCDVLAEGSTWFAEVMLEMLDRKQGDVIEAARELFDYLQALEYRAEEFNFLKKTMVNKNLMDRLCCLGDAEAIPAYWGSYYRDYCMQFYMHSDLPGKGVSENYYMVLIQFIWVVVVQNTIPAIENPAYREIYRDRLYAELDLLKYGVTGIGNRAEVQLKAE